MQTRWEGRNVDLELLSMKIIEFLERKNFDVVNQVSEKTIEIVSSYSEGDTYVSFVIRIEGDSNDFKVDLKGPESERIRFFSPFLEMVGMGFLFSKKVKVFDLCQKLEDEFWVFLDEIVPSISGSGSGS